MLVGGEQVEKGRHHSKWVSVLIAKQEGVPVMSPQKGSLRWRHNTAAVGGSAIPLQHRSRLTLKYLKNALFAFDLRVRASLLVCVSGLKCRPAVRRGLLHLAT